MRKLAATFLILMASASLYALPLGNPWDASLLTDGICMEGSCIDCCDPNATICDGWSFRFGFYGDYVFNRHMETDDKDKHACIHDTEIYTNAAYWAVNYCNRADIFGTLGQSKIVMETPRRTFFVNPTNTLIDPPDNRYCRIETESDFSWSVGIRATLWECECLAIGGEFQYFQTRPDMNSYTAEGEPPRYLGEIAKYHEYQFGFGAAYRINIAACDRTAAVPYVGVKFSHAQLALGDVIFEDGPFSTFRAKDLESERYLGFAVGVTLVGCEKWSVTAEGRFFDEQAFHVNSQIRF